MSKRPAEDAATEENKRFRSAIDAMADDWLCPITCELPIDPVIAEDGRTYERSAIEAHIRARHAELKSPMTNEPMGPRLLPNAQARSTMEKLVRTGAITGDKAELWRKRIKDEEKVLKTRAAAEGGDAEAMHKMGSYHHHGIHGVAKDAAEAYKWYKRGADAHEPKGMDCAAFCLLYGYGVEENTVHAMILLTRAAACGADSAAYLLGCCYYDGHNGVPQDSTQALYWYEKVACAAIKHLKHGLVELAAQRVRELRGE